MIKTVCTPEGQVDIEMTAEEIAAFEAERAVSQSAQDADILKAEAIHALLRSDAVAIRCVKAGMAFPLEWKTYVDQLRAIISSGTGDIPLQPAYPAGS